jgi:hypothetical protein
MWTRGDEVTTAIGEPEDEAKCVVEEALKNSARVVAAHAELANQDEASAVDPSWWADIDLSEMLETCPPTLRAVPAPLVSAWTDVVRDAARQAASEDPADSDRDGNNSPWHLACFWLPLAAEALAGRGGARQDFCPASSTASLCGGRATGRHSWQTRRPPRLGADANRRLPLSAYSI